MLRRLGIRGKVLAALSVPVLVLVALAGLVSLQSVNEAQTARTVTTLLETIQSSRVAVKALQDERLASMPYSEGNSSEGVVATMNEARKATDDAVGYFRRNSAKIDYTTLDPAVEQAVKDLKGMLATVEDARGRVDAQNVPAQSIITNFNDVIASAIDFSRNASDPLPDRRLAAILSAHAGVSALAEAYSAEASMGRALLGPDLDPDQIRLDLATMFALSQAAQRSGPEGVRQLDLDKGINVPPLGASWDGVHSYDGYRALVASGDPTNYNFITPDEWVTYAMAEVEGFDEVQGELRETAVDRANEVASATLRSTIITIGAAVAAVIISIMTALAIARQIIVPLRRLTEAAGMVRDELPRLVDQVAIPGQGPDLSLTRIPVTSRDEIGQLAAAFNEVNTTTIHVAQEQAALRGAIAEMFVNVARRDQVLLNRQLSFIDALERSEEDPKTLADLFRLDHLATRMRRNAESLLVLAGIETGRRLRETLALSDVIRTASSEIEHYERVQLDLPVDPMMLGHTALPAAHMMAELLENATVFSEPGTPVQVSTGTDEDSVIITILDQGLGMTPHEFEEANTKIRATSASDVLGSQRLGMFVVGRIAARLGASVELSLGPDGTGTLATIRMPRVLFLDAATIPLVPVTRTASPATVQTFVLPDEAAEVVHDAAFAPLPEHVQDVASGALGSAENPAEAVDLKKLTDGTTGLGLPKRRARGVEEDAPAPSVSHRDEDDAAAAPSIPLAPAPELLEGAAATVADEVWQPPVIQHSAPLVTRRGPDADAPALPARGAGGMPSREPKAVTGGLPVREPGSATGGLPVRGAATGLPTREPAAAPAAGLPTRQPASAASAGLPTRQPALPARQPAAPAPIAPAGSAPVNPDGRSAMFGSFRSRRAELAAAAVTVDSGDASAPAAGQGDGAERLAAAAASASFFGRSAPTAPEVPAFVIPALVEDDDDEPFLPAVTPVPFAEVAPEPSVQEIAPAAPVVPSAPAAEARAEKPTLPLVPAPAAEQAPPRRRARHALPGPEDLEPASRTGAQRIVPPAPVAAAPVPPVPPAPVVPVAWEGQPAVEWPATVQPAPLAWDQPAAEWEAPVAPEPSGWEAQPAPAAWAQPVPVSEVDDVAWPTPDQQGWSADAPEQPVSLDAMPPDPFAPAQLTEVPHPATAPDFNEVVQGAPDEGAGKRRWWSFGRKRAEQAVPPVQEPQQDAVFFTGPVSPAPSAAPSRQSAWSSVDTGAHTFSPPPAPELAVPGPAFALAAESFAPPPPAAPPVFMPSEASVAPEPSMPAAPPVSSWQAPVAAAPGWQAPAEAALSAQASAPAWAPTPGWSAPEGHAAATVPPTPRSAPTAFSPQTSFTPQPSGGAFDDEMTSMLAQRADLAQQALAELSQLSSYRPKAVSTGAPSNLVRRTPGSIPAAPAIELPPSGQRTERDANQVRSLLSSFQSGTSRGRKASDTPDADPADAAPQIPGGETPAGHEDGPEGMHGEAVMTPDADLNQRSTSW